MNATADSQIIDLAAVSPGLAVEIRAEIKRARMSERLHSSRAAQETDEAGRDFYTRRARAAYRHRNELRRLLLAVDPESGVTTR